MCDQFFLLFLGKTNTNSFFSTLSWLYGHQWPYWAWQACCHSTCSRPSVLSSMVHSSLMVVMSLDTEEISFFSRGSSYCSNNYLLDWDQDCCQANLWPGKAAQPGKPWSAWRFGMVRHPQESVCSQAAPWSWAGGPPTQSGSVRRSLCHILEESRGHHTLDCQKNTRKP